MKTTNLINNRGSLATLFNILYMDYALPRLPKDLRQLEIENKLSDAYSSIKVQYLEVKDQLGRCKSNIRKLEKELEDYQIRYNHLIKYLNTNELI